MGRPLPIRRPSPEMTVAEVADALGLTDYQVRRRIEAGALPGRRVGPKGGRFVVSRAELLAWVRGEPAVEVAAEPARLDLAALLGAELTLQVTVRVVGIRKLGEDRTT